MPLLRFSLSLLRLLSRRASSISPLPATLRFSPPADTWAAFRFICLPIAAAVSPYWRDASFLPSCGGFQLIVSLLPQVFTFRLYFFRSLGYFAIQLPFSYCHFRRCLPLFLSLLPFLSLSNNISEPRLLIISRCGFWLQIFRHFSWLLRFFFFILPFRRLLFAASHFLPLSRHCAISLRHAIFHAAIDFRCH